MSWFILFVGVVVVCFAAALVLGLIGGGSVGGLGGDTRTLSHEPLPDDEIVDADFDDLVFDVGLRGYRMSQVDGVVDRLRRELREKNEEIAVLRGPVPPALPIVQAEQGGQPEHEGEPDPGERPEQRESEQRQQPKQPEEPEHPVGREHRP